jgi:hypothetical protein
VWCRAMCVRVWDDVEWAEEEEYGEGDGDRACVHVHRVVGCEGLRRWCECGTCVWCVGWRWCWVDVPESPGVLACDEMCVFGVSCGICVNECAG